MGYLKLIAAPDSHSLIRAKRYLEGQSFTWVFLGQDVGAFHLVEKSFRDCGSQLEITGRIHRAAQALRKPYLEYVFGLSKRPSSLCWWMTSVSYRSSYVSKTFYQCCQLKVALDLTKTWEGIGPLVMVAADKPVRQALANNLAPSKIKIIGPWRTNPLQIAGDRFKLMAHRAFFLVRETKRLLDARRIVTTPHVPTKPTTLLVSTVHQGNLKRNGDFHRPHWGELEDRLTGLGTRLAMVPLVMRDVSYQDALLRVQQSSVPVVVPHRYLKLQDLLRAAVSTYRKIPLDKPLPQLERMDISPLIHEDLRVHWVSNRGADFMLLEALTKRLAILGACVNRIIFKYENQPWERALCWGAKRHLPKAVLVGYQHARAPLLYLNYQLAPGEVMEAPLPDRVVTIGEHTAKLLSAEGYRKGQIIAGAALHIPPLEKDQPHAGKSRSSGGVPTVLVAGSYGLEESYELADLAARLFNPTDGVKIVFKCHPATPFSSFKHLMLVPLPSHVHISEEPITELISRSSLMIYTGSMVSVQALAASLPVIHLRPEFDLDLDPLGAVPEVRLEATGLNEMRKQVKWLLANNEDYIAEHRIRWAKLVDEIYGPVTTEAIQAFLG